METPEKGADMFLRHKKLVLPTPDQALPGREAPMPVAERHTVLGTPLTGPFPALAATAVFGMGCFWGAERLFWRLPGVISTSVGYAGGITPNPTYEEVCSGYTGHAEVVRVIYDPTRITYADLLKVFWENHDPTQGMRQGNDVGTQYRSLILTTSDEQRAEAESSREAFAPVVRAAGTARSPPRSASSATTTWPRTTTSSTCPTRRTPTGTATTAPTV